MNLPQALYAAIHRTDGDLARAIDRLPLRESTENYPGRFKSSGE